MNVRALKLRDRDFGEQWFKETKDRWEYADYKRDIGWRKDWISIDCLCHDPVTDTVFAGITSFDADIFRGWDRQKAAWISTGYERVANEYDAKFHRSLVRDSRSGCLYGAVALLHDIDRFWHAPGGAIVRYVPASGAVTKLAVPMPHVYIQAICLDESRDTIYGQTFTPENLVSFNLRTGESTWIGPTSSGFGMAQGENIVLDDNGCVWGVWTVTRAWQDGPGVDQYRLYKYDPRTGSIEYMDKGLPRPDGSYGFVRPEGLFNFHTGALYASGDGGAVFRIDPHSGDAEYLWRPVGDEGRGRRSRLASMRMGPDGYAYGVTGRDGECEIIKVDVAKEQFELLGPLAESDGAAAWQIHDVCITPDGVLYAGENDNPRRSGYLWEIELP